MKCRFFSRSTFITFLNAFVPTVLHKKCIKTKHCLSFIFLGGEIFVVAHRYDEIIQLFAALIISDLSMALFRNVQQSVIKGNSLLSYACTDILLLASR